MRVSIGGLVAIGAIAAVAVLGTSGSGDSSPVVPSAQAATSKPRPTVSFTSPKSGALVTGSIKVSAKVSASPRITRVEFRVDGKLRWTDRRAPFVMNGDRGRLATSTMSNGTHTLTVTAVAANGTRRSATRSFRVRRSRGSAPVGSGGGAGTTTTPPAPPAAPAPTSSPAPTNLRLGLATQSALGVTWSASPGAVAYGVYLNGIRAAETTGTTYTLGSLSCGTSYRILVDSVASGGARSARATIVAGTVACPPPSVFLSPSGNDGNNCSAGAPCQTLDRGYRAAAPGAVVQLAGGSYPGGGIGNDPSKNGAASRVVLAAAPGASVSTGDLNIDAQHVEFRDISMSLWQTSPQAADVMFRNVSQKLFYINSSRQIALVGGSAGPSVNAHPQIQSDITTPPRDILIDGVAFHDFTRNDPNVHTECLQIGASDGLTIRNSTFRNCHATANIGLGHWGPSPDTKNVTIENNFFSATVDGYYSIQANAVENMLIRNNSATQGFLLNERGTTINVRMVANLAPMGSWECMAGVQYRNNVWFWAANGGAAKCHSSDTALTGVSNPGFVNPGALDLHLTASSPALGRGAASEAAPTDIDGEPRGASPDAGADER